MLLSQLTPDPLCEEQLRYHPPATTSDSFVARPLWTIPRLVLACALQPMNTARRYFVRGRVQGVGYRYFVQEQAAWLGVKGYTRNLDDGRVEVYAIGSEAQLSALEGLLRKGPQWSDVRA